MCVIFLLLGREAALLADEHGVDVRRTDTWVLVDVPYLREQAQRCARLAHDCSRMLTENVAQEFRAVVHELEAIGI
jgi:hypothetical protein